MRRISSLLLICMLALTARSQNVIVVIKQITTNVTSCKNDTVRVVIKNNTASALTNHSLQAVFSINVTWGSIAVTRGTVNLTNISATNHRFTFPSLAAGDSAIFQYIVTVNCNSIPTTPPTSGGVVIALTDNVTFSFLNASNTTYSGTVTYNGVSSGAYSYSINYPSLASNTLSTLNTTTTYYGGTEDTFVRRFVYQNNGTTSFNGRVNFKDVFSCASINIIEFRVYVGKVTVDTTGKITTAPILTSTPIILSSGDSFSFRLDTSSNSINRVLYPSGFLLSTDSAQLIIEEKVTITGCLSTTCNSGIQLDWGCVPNEACKRVSRNSYVFHTNITPQHKISRLLPAASYNATADFFWDNSCMNTDTTWEFLIQNLNTSSVNLYSDTIVLDKVDISSYTFIDSSSVKFNYAKTTGSLTVSSLPNVTAIFDRLTTADYTAGNVPVPQCLSNFATPIKRVRIVVPKMKPGDKILISFKTYRCCPTDSFLFNRGKNFNHWDISAKGKNDCDTVYVAAAYRNNTSTPKLYNINSNYHIGSTAYLLGTDLDLVQDCQASVSDMAGISPSGCGSASNFSITNFRLIGTQDDEQLFFDSVNIYGTGLKPHGQIKVSFQLDNSLRLPNPALTPPFTGLNITAGNNIWKPVSVTATGSGNSVDVIFSIDSLPASLKIGDAFKNFIDGSRLNFSLQACCPTNGPNDTCTILTYFKPQPKLSCSSCFIPMSRQIVPLNIHCPGCVTPGIIIQGFDMLRTNYGYPDTNNNGLAESSNALTSIYSKFSLVNRRASIVGDTLQSIVTAFFNDGDATTGGYTYQQWKTQWNDAYKYLYLEQRIPGSEDSVLSLQLLTDTFYYQPKDSSQWLAMALDVNNPNDVLRTGNTYFHKLGIQKIRNYFGNANLNVAANDHYKIVTTFRVCKNYTGNTYLVSNINNFMYHTVDSLTAPAFATHYLLGDYYGLHNHTGVSHPDSVPPSVTAIAQCEAFGGNHFFFPVKQSFTATWSDLVGTGGTSSCAKTMTSTVKIWIAGLPQNPFPYEFRLVPGFNSTNVAAGLLAHTLPDSLFHIDVTPPSGYTVLPRQISTRFFTYLSNSAFTALLDTVAAPWADTTVNGTKVQFKFKPVYDIAKYPFSYSLGSLNPTLITAQKVGKLLMGDEYFEQTVIFDVRPSCSSTADTVLLNDSMVTASMPGFGCNASSVTVKNPTFYYSPTSTDKLTLPKPSIASNYVDNIMSTASTCLTKTHWFTKSPTDNFFIYIDTTTLPSCFVVDSLKSINTLITPTISGKYLYYKLGNFAYSDYTTLQLCGHSRCCNSAGTYIIRYNASWSCDSFPASVPPPANFCHTPFKDSIKVIIKDASFQWLSQTKPASYYSCDTQTYNLCLQSVAGGALNSFKLRLKLHPNMNLVSTGLTYAVNNGSNISVSPAAITADTGNVYNISLSSVSLANTDKLCLTFKTSVLTCNTLTDSLYVLFSAKKYCGDSIGLYYVFPKPSFAGSHCASPTVTLTSKSGSCTPVDSGYINLTVNGVGTYSYLWSNDATTRDIHGLSSGTYKVTVSNACTTVVFTDSVKTSLAAYSFPTYIQSSSGGVVVISELETDSSNNIYVAGAYSPSAQFSPPLGPTKTASGFGFFISKYCSNGYIDWIRDDNAALKSNHILKVDRSGNTYYVLQNNLIKINTYGVKQWTRAFSPDSNSIGQSLFLDSDNSLYIAYDSTNLGKHFITKVDSNANLLWGSKQFICHNIIPGIIAKKTGTNSDKIIVVSDVSYSAFLKSNGNLIQRQLYYFDSDIQAVYIDSSDYVYAITSGYKTLNIPPSCLLDGGKVISFSIDYSSPFDNIISPNQWVDSLAAEGLTIKDNNLYLCGLSKVYKENLSPPTSPNRVWQQRYTDIQTFPDTCSNSSASTGFYSRSITIGKNDTIFIAGDYEINVALTFPPFTAVTQSVPGAFIARLNTSGTFYKTDGEEDVAGGTIQQQVSISNSNISVYPNPTRGLFTIDIHALEETNTICDLFDMLGQHLLSVSLGTVREAKKEINLNGYAKGTYLLRTKMGDDITYTKIVLSR